MLQILLPRLHRLGIVFQVVVAIGQRDPALVEDRNGFGRIVHVGLGEEGKQRRRGIAVHVCHLPNEIGFRLDTVNAFQFRRQGRNPLFLDRALVHAGAVVSTHHGFNCRVFARSLRLGQQVAQDIEIVLLELVEPAPPRLIGRNGIVFHPGSTGVLVEVHTGIDSLIDGGDVEAGDFLGKGGRRRAGLGRTEYGDQQHGKKKGNASRLHSCLEL